ncbi:MAG TPA: hypothetical protein VE010_16820, partial [Thermoanaerobaculia bacterium]|nr:hypothetical protein [Thermoanaerobaculia bacterium]
MEKAAILVAVLLVLAPIAGHRPERKPGNLTPVQLISALGAWALVFANASALAIAIREESVLLFCTASTALGVALISFVWGSAGSVSAGEAPEAVKLVVEDLEQLLGGAPRLGMHSLEAIVVNGRGPGIGVAIAQQRRVVVRIRDDVARWLERHQQAGGAGAEVTASFARFTVLHELAHVLNGDHRTFRFVRCVTIAQLVWIAGVLASAASLVATRTASVTPVIAALSIIVLLLVQTLVARRFIAERERLADWRAMQTLPPADAARLLERRGRRRGVAAPTELEKLMIDLKVQAPSRAAGGLLSRLIAVTWPQVDDIRKRCERAGGDRAGSMPRPVLWAALLGMQCGLLSMSLALALILAASWWADAPPYASSMWMTAVMASVAAPVATFCQLRVDPARMSVRKVRHTSRRIVVGVVFYLAFVASALALYRFHVRLHVPSMPPAPYFAAVLVSVSFFVAIGSWTGGMGGSGDGGGELTMTPRSSWVWLVPGLAGLLLVLLPLSVIASRWLGTGTFLSGGWVPLMLLAFAGFVVSTGMARSTSATLRAIAPVAVLDTPPP